jgi:hypothetical protein
MLGVAALCPLALLFVGVPVALEAATPLHDGDAGLH